MVEQVTSEARRADFRRVRANNILPFGSEPASKELVRALKEGTQFPGETHRRQAARLSVAWVNDGKEMMRLLDQQVAATSNNVNRSTTVYDFIVIGSGPHGAAVVAYLREKYPSMSTLLIEQADRIGGQWRAYGDKASYVMNSQIRQADRRLPSLPGTPGNINVLGQFAPMELSDVVTTAYATNMEMGNVCAINGYLSAGDFVVGKTVTGTGELFSDQVNQYVKYVRFADDSLVQARVLFDATGLPLVSEDALAPGLQDDPNYLDTAAFYRHMSTAPEPLRRFKDKTITVIGGGDSACSVFEGLFGWLPPDVYGSSGAARNRPASIDWFGARDDFAECARSRYKSTVVPNLRRGDKQSGVITQRPGGPVGNVQKFGDQFAIATSRGSFASFSQIVINTVTVQARRDRQFDYAVKVGPGVRRSAVVEQAIERLQIPENSVSLWATMPSTMDLVEREAAVVAAEKAAQVRRDAF